MDTNIRNHHILFHSCATFCVNPSPSLQRFTWQRVLWGTGKELIRKTHTVNVQHIPKRFANMGYEQNCWAKTSSKKVGNISGRSILPTPHFLPQLSPVKSRTGLSAEVFNEVVKCAKIF